MTHNKIATVAAAAAAAAAIVIASGVAFSAPAFAATPASGSAVISESNTFFEQAASTGIVAVTGSPATGAFNSSTGLSGTFPVTGGDASLSSLFGTIDFGGKLQVVHVDVKSHKVSSVTFTQLGLDIDTFQLIGVPQGSTTPVALFDPAGDESIATVNGVPTLEASDLDIDPAGAQYLDAQLKTGFFTAGQSVGSLSVAFTPAS